MIARISAEKIKVSYDGVQGASCLVSPDCLKKNIPGLKPGIFSNLC
jgi:hypothetical protein